MPKTIHINLVSHQLLPNIITSLSYPDCDGVVIVLGDKKMTAKADALKAIYEDNNVKVIDTVTSEGDSHDYLSQLNCAKLIKEKLTKFYADATIMLNLTGGTKPMALAYSDVFRELDNCHRLYTDTTNKCIRLMNELNVTIPFHSVMDLKSYLKAYDFRITAQQSLTKLHANSQLTKRLAKRLCGPDLNAVAILNKFASEARDQWQTKNQSSPLPMQNNRVFSSQLKELLEDYDNGAVKLTRDTIEFTTNQSAVYFGGIWLEEYVALCAIDADVGVVGMGVNGVWGDTHGRSNKVKNEFDLLLLHHNQLLVIECKTSKFDESGVGQQVINKLDVLTKKLSGGFSKSLVVSVNRLPDAAAERAKQYGIAFCVGSEITKITDKIKHWKDTVSG